MDYIINGLIGIICSVVAAWIFWYFSFKRTNVNIKFADKIEKKRSSFGDEGCSYRLKLINVGNENIIEVSFFAKMFIKENKIKHTCYLSFGHNGFTPILYGKKWQNREKNKSTGFSWTVELGMADTTFREFSKQFYPEKIREAAAKGTLTLEKILNTFGENVEIAIFAFGYDSVTGARKMFVSKRYTKNDILEGTYRRSVPAKRYKEYINNMLSIDTQKVSANLLETSGNKSDTN